MKGTVHLLSRRQVLVDLGRGAIAVAVLGSAAACTGEDSPPPSGAGSPTSGTSPVPTMTEPVPEDPVTWKRAGFADVSAYVLLRGSQAVVVDTGESEDAVGEIEKALTTAGGNWDAVRHVILTHQHPDHVGGLDAVLARATRAVPAVGEADLSGVLSSRPLTPLHDGDELFGLRIIGTPGHTPGHISVHDPDTGLVVVGDAMVNLGGLSGSMPQYTADPEQAAASVRVVAKLRPRTLLFGHGDPMTRGTAKQLDQLVASL